MTLCATGFTAVQSSVNLPAASGCPQNSNWLSKMKTCQSAYVYLANPVGEDPETKGIQHKVAVQ